MDSLVNALRSRMTSFQIGFSLLKPIDRQIKDCLLNNPDLLGSIESFGVQWNFLTRRAHFTVGYRIDNSEMTIVVRDYFELLTAITMILKSHKSKVKIVVDNRKKFVSSNNIFEYIQKVEIDTGIEYELDQRSQTTLSTMSYFNDEILVCDLVYTYFDDYKTVNSLSCVVAEHFIKSQIPKSDPKKAVNYLMNWFRNNVSYKQNNVSADHSAVGLIRNGTAVCQGIAVYAYMFFKECGVNARIATGEGRGDNGWEAHAWNMVLVDGEWKHVDFTFDLNSDSLSAFHPMFMFRMSHRWDESLFSNEKSNRVSEVSEKLSHSIVTLLKNQKIFSINGCIMYLPSLPQTNRAIGEEMYIALAEILPFMGGSSSFIGEVCNIYLKGQKKQISINNLLRIDNVLYFPISILVDLNVDISYTDKTISIKLKD